MSSVDPTTAFTYTGECQIKFGRDPKGKLMVNIDTDRLLIRSVRWEDMEHYKTLFHDKSVQEISAWIDGWVQRWNNEDPFSGFTIFDSGTNEFIGHIALGHAGGAGIARLTGRCVPYQKEPGISIEATTAIIKGFAPSTIRHGYQLGGKPLEVVTASAKTSDMKKMLTDLGMANSEGEEFFIAVK